MLTSRCLQLRRLVEATGRRCFFGLNRGSVASTSTAALEEREKETGLFGNDTLRNPDAFLHMNGRVRKASKALVERIVARVDAATPPPQEEKTTVRLFDDLSNEICSAADLSECIRQLHADPNFAEAAEASARDFCDLVESLNTHTPLYTSLKRSLDVEAERLDAVDRRTIGLFLDDFEQSGVNLEEGKQAEFVALSGRIFEASARFQKGCDQPVEVPKVDRARFGLGACLTSPVLYTMESSKRKFAHTAFMRYNPEQEKNLIALVTARDELARLTGYKTFAHRAQTNSLLGTYENTHDFLLGVIQACRPAVDRELAAVIDIAKQVDHTVLTIGEWDLPFLTYMYKTKAFGERNLNRFLTLGGVLAAFERVVNKLYGVRFEIQEPKKGEVWASSVQKVAVFDKENVFRGLIYLDVEKRSGKAIGDCHYTVRCSKQLDGNRWQTPIVVLSLSLAEQGVAKAIGDWKNVIMGVQHAENFFHEMGHAMHSILGRTRYQHVAGTRCPQDLSEVPSNLMEYFFHDIRVMRAVFRSPEGEEMNIDDAAALISARFAFSSLEIVQQAVYALFDLEVHGSAAEGLIKGRYSSTDLFGQLWVKALPFVERGKDSAFQHRFHHLVQYGARYSAYLVARATASLVWAARFRDDPLNAKEGERWASVQAQGGGVPSAELLAMVLGHSPTGVHLIDALKKEAAAVSRLEPVNV